MRRARSRAGRKRVTTSWTISAVSMTEIVEAIAEYTGSPAPFSVPAWLPRLVAPYMARMTSIRMPLSNARSEGGARLAAEILDDATTGWRDMFRHAA